LPQKQISTVDTVKEGEAVRSLSRAEFAELAAQGGVTAETKVFDTSIQTVEQFASKWELPFSEAWHAEAFDLP